MAAPTAAQQANINLLNDDLRSLLQQYSVDWHIQSELGRLQYNNTDAFSAMYIDLNDLIAQSPTELTFRGAAPGPDNGYTPETSKRARIRLQLAWDQAKTMRNNRQTVLAANVGDPAQLRALAQGGNRENSESIYSQRHGYKPELKHQGCDHLFGMLYKDMSSSYFGVYPHKQRVGRLDQHLKTTTTRKRDSQGVETTQEVQELAPANTLAEFRHGCDVLKSTTLMVAYILPNITQIQVTHTQLTNFYNFLFGPSIAEKTPQPSLATLISAELEAWRWISTKMHEGSTLGAALDDVIKDALLWTRTVYQRTSQNTSWNQTGGGKYGGGKYGGNGAGKGGGNQWGGKNGGNAYPQYNNYNNKGAGKKGGGKKGGGKKGAGKGAGKAPKGGKGKGKGLTPVDPTVATSMAKMTPATTNYPQGQPVCYNFHAGNGCYGGCGRSHNVCPKLLADGSYCWGNHSLRTCTKT